MADRGLKEALVEIRLDNRIEPFTRTDRPIEARHHGLLQLHIGFTHRVLEQFLLVGEIMQHDAFRGACLRRHPFKRGTRHSLTLKDFECSPPQLRPANIAYLGQSHLCLLA
ncbi:hypothetical protein D3C86_1876100 [compost metagenome]